MKHGVKCVASKLDDTTPHGSRGAPGQSDLLSVGQVPESLMVGFQELYGSVDLQDITLLTL